MFFFLSKTLLFLISPFFWIVIGFIVFLRTKNQNLKRILKYALPLCLFLFTNTVFFLEICRLWEIPGTRENVVEHHEVGVVLGGMFEYDGNLERLSIRRGGDRLIQAVSLLKNGKIDHILISGDNGYLTNKGLHEAVQTKQLLGTWGIPDSLLLIDSSSVNTYENARNCAKILRKNNMTNSVLLITSGIHMKRALGCFKRQGVDATPYSTDLYTGKKRGYSLDQWIVPNVYNFVLWNYLLKEVVGYVTYDVKGYL